MRDTPPADTEETWRSVWRDATRQLEAAGIAPADREARWMVEVATGCEPGEWLDELTRTPPRRQLAHLDAMVARRMGGEPLQYVLGSWPFRTLDLAVDRRALIPRPETEGVVDVALAEVDRVASLGSGADVVVVDLGTGTGAIALSVAAERSGVEVWATDVDPAALDLARSNLAGLGRRGAAVRLAEGPWFAALPAELAGLVGVVVSNPPYVAEGEVLAPEVAAWEPRRALVAGPEGTEHLVTILDEARTWLVPGGAVVLELAPGQAVGLAAHARAVGYVEVDVVADLAGRPRCLRARSRAA